MKVGSFLENERYFLSESEAPPWCQRWLREVAGEPRLRTFRLTQIDADSGVFLSTSASRAAESP
jgi:hypothetical protein